jgi:hypothetical protein
MVYDAIIYLVAASAYGYAAWRSFARGEYYSACKDIVSAFLYVCLAIAILDPCITRPCTITA